MSEIRLSHYTRQPLELDRTRTYEQPDRPFSHQKPKGFWVSCDGEFDWKEWCTSEEWNTESLENRTVIVLSGTANVLMLETQEQVLAFTEEYAKLDEAYADLPADRAVYHRGIDWLTVAERYDGIIITPYQWELRYDNATSWYYGWDCASGCIWNLAALVLVEDRVEEPVIPGGYTMTSRADVS